jgi:3-methyladenine DNA glycosylase AlkD
MSQIKNPDHLEILKQLNHFGEPNLNGFDIKYVGTKKPSYHLKTEVQKQIIKKILKSHSFDLTGFVDLINSLYQYGTSYDEIIIAGRVVGALPKLRKQLQPSLLNNWLNYTQGWAEVDTLCQLSYTPDELISKWDQWQDVLTKLNSDDNIHKRRASLVLLTKPVSHSTDPRLSNLAFKNTNNLKLEKDILITKAVSWILRSLIKYHQAEVAKYLKDNKDSLPKIAYREATTKLLTGRKTK